MFWWQARRSARGAKKRKICATSCRVQQVWPAGHVPRLAAGTASRWGIGSHFFVHKVRAAKVWRPGRPVSSSSAARCSPVINCRRSRVSPPVALDHPAPSATARQRVDATTASVLSMTPAFGHAVQDDQKPASSPSSAGRAGWPRASRPGPSSPVRLKLRLPRRTASCPSKSSWPAVYCEGVVFQCDQLCPVPSRTSLFAPVALSFFRQWVVEQRECRVTGGVFVCTYEYTAVLYYRPDRPDMWLRLGCWVACFFFCCPPSMDASVGPSCRRCPSDVEACTTTVPSSLPYTYVHAASQPWPPGAVVPLRTCERLLAALALDFTIRPVRCPGHTSSSDRLSGLVNNLSRRLVEKGHV